jgi:hypothetical protein
MMTAAHPAIQRMGMAMTKATAAPRATANPSPKQKT